MATIHSALYKKDGKVKELTLTDFKSLEDKLKYKRYLFCALPKCGARLVYVHCTSRPSFFRTWKNDDHDKNCIYYFERSDGRAGISTEQVINVELSSERKKKALNRAFQKVQLSEAEIEERNKKRAKRKQSPRSRGKNKSVSVNPVMSNGVGEEEITAKGTRGPNLLIRDIEGLRDSDIGKARLLIGDICSISYESKRAIIILKQNKTKLKVKFEEAFFANSPNLEGLFHYIERFINEYENPLFTAVGEVRYVSENQEQFEFYVYGGEEFRIHNMTLPSLAAFYSREDLS